MTRALGTALAAVTATLVFALPASAARPGPGDHTLTTAHFMVHYYTDTINGAPGEDYSTQTDAGDVASYAEQAYAAYRSWGFPAPPSDGDGLIDIWITDLSKPTQIASIASPDTAGPAGGTAYFQIATPKQLGELAALVGMTPEQEEQQTVAANVFYMFEAGQWIPATGSDYWLLYGPGTWASFDAMGFQPPTLALGNPDIALDCSEDLLPDHQMCDPDGYSDQGMARWAFFELLASRFGKSFLTGAFANGAAGETSTAALSNALAAEGTTLAAVYTDYVNHFMSGTLGPLQLAALRPSAYATVTTGVNPVTTTTTAAIVPVNHLSARYVTFQRGDGDGSHACYAAMLTVNVLMPSGTLSQPDFFWDVPGSSPQVLTVNGNTASITVPWDTCDWGATRAWVSLPNASTTVDGATFTVTYSMSVDTSTPASASSAPAPASIWGDTVPVPTDDVAPDIEVYGPELVHVDATSPSIRLIVESDNVGTLNATLGGVTLGQAALRAGNNDVRFAVPKGLLTSLRRAAASSDLLTLTPVSPSGAATGQAVTRHVVITVAKAKAAAKKKPKPAAKKHKK